MNDQYIINGITYRKVETPVDNKRIVRWVFNDIVSPIKFSEGCTKLVEIKDGERILSRDEVYKVLRSWVVADSAEILKELGFDK